VGRWKCEAYLFVGMYLLWECDERGSEFVMTFGYDWRERNFVSPSLVMYLFYFVTFNKYGDVVRRKNDN
jgi:hypothetical protein